MSSFTSTSVRKKVSWNEETLSLALLLRRTQDRMDEWMDGLEASGCWRSQKTTMQLLLVVCLALAATNTPSATTAGKSWTGRLVTKTPSLVTWLIDGTNLACSRHVPGDREALVERLQEIASPIGTSAADDDGTTIVTNVVLVFDGDEDEVFSKSTFGWFQQIVTDGKGKVKDRADDHIVQHVLPELQQLNGRVHLVSADKELGKRVQASGVMKGGSMVHPPKFWKEYLPNLQQRRQVQAQQRKKSM